MIFRSFTAFLPHHSSHYHYCQDVVIASHKHNGVDIARSTHPNADSGVDTLEGQQSDFTSSTNSAPAHRTSKPKPKKKSGISLTPAERSLTRITQ